MGASDVCRSNAVQLFMAMNYFSSIFIVFLNKWAYNYGFPSVTLTLLHFLVTFVGLKICSLFGMFQVKRLSIVSILPLSLAFCGFVVLTNLSLTYNTVGFYQLSKVLTTPCIIALQVAYYRQHFSREILLSLVPVLLGVALASKADVSFNTVGATYAFLGVLVTSFYQIWVKTKQASLEANAFQLLYYQAPLSSAILLVILPFVEPPFGSNGVLTREWSGEAWFFVLMSSVMAFAVNLSIFLVIGKTSPVTYNVLGHFKLCSVLGGGFLLFHDPVNSMQGLGIVLTLVGIFAYTHVSLKEAAAPKAPLLPTSSSSAQKS